MNFFSCKTIRKNDNIHTLSRAAGTQALASPRGDGEEGKVCTWCLSYTGHCFFPQSVLSGSQSISHPYQILLSIDIQLK